MDFNLEKIDLALIDLSISTFRITTHTGINDLKASMADVGLLVPPLIVKGAGPKYTVISGFRRLSAAVDLGYRYIEARVLDPGTPMINRAKFAIAENSFQRQLNVIEQSRSVQLLSSFFSSEKKFTRAAADLFLPANPSIRQKLLRLSTLPECLQNSVLNKTVSFIVALELEKYESTDIIRVSGLFDMLKPSLSKQREIVTLLSEISLIENIAISDIVEEEMIQNIMTNDAIDRSQKMEKIRIGLKQRRFPEITRAEQKFKSSIKALKLDANTRLLPPKSFEGTTYFLNFSFRNADELKKCQIMMNKIIKNPAIHDILNS